MPPFVLGKTARNLAASENLWEFFAPFAVTLHAKRINEPTSEVNRQLSWARSCYCRDD